jgi:RTX calcium-binding nonapeptide repeat (4 copies)
MRRALPLLAVAVLFLFGGGSSAAPPSGIVVRAASSGSHLRLTVDGSHLLVNGYLARAQPVGCRLTRGRSAATCSLEEAGSVTIEMGPGDDKVEVLDPLPVPLTAYLGGGSDKLIGNAEPDTCYPQGTRRNRCVGGGGNDVCITGQENTDCVGGPGNDYCKAGDGSDGCWGGPGDDVCEMGAGQDGCHGGPGDDRLFGGPGADQLYGGSGRDYCDGGPGVGRSHECESGPGH